MKLRKILKIIAFIFMTIGGFYVLQIIIVLPPMIIIHLAEEYPHTKLPEVLPKFIFWYSIHLMMLAVGFILYILTGGKKNDSPKP